MVGHISQLRVRQHTHIYTNRKEERRKILYIVYHILYIIEIYITYNRKVLYILSIYIPSGHEFLGGHYFTQDTQVE